MSKQNITPEEVQKIATLARLKLTDEDVQKFTGQLSSIFDYINQLQKVDTKGVEPIAQVTGLKSVTRDDVVDQQEIQDKLINCAPETEERFVKVKNVF